MYMGAREKAPGIEVVGWARLLCREALRHQLEGANRAVEEDLKLGEIRQRRLLGSMFDGSERIEARLR